MIALYHALMVLATFITPHDGVTPTTTTITFLQQANVTSCLSNHTNGSVVVDNALMTINFQESANMYSVYQIPKCVFTSDISLQLMREMDFSETLESYKKRYRDYFMVSIDGSYRFFSQAIVPSGISPEHTPSDKDTVVSSGEVNLTVTEHHVPFVNGTISHAPKLHPDPCLLFINNKAIFPVVTNCVVQRFVITNDVTYNVTLTDDFFVISVEESPVRYGHIIFGNLKKVFVKAPYEKSTFTFRQTEKHDLMMVFTKDMVRGQYSHVTYEDFLYDVLSINYENITLLYDIIDQKATFMLMNDKCGRGNRWTNEMLFMYALFIMSSKTHGHKKLESAQDFIYRQRRISTLQDFMIRCMDRTATPIYFENAMETAGALLRHQPQSASWITNYMQLELVYVTVTTNGTITVTHDTLKALLYEFMMPIHKHAMMRVLNGHERSTLYMLNDISHLAYEHADMRRLAFAIQTGICSPKELYQWSAYVYSGNRGITGMYTPCAGSGRHDYTQDRMNSLFMLNMRKEINTDVLRGIFAHYQLYGVSTFAQLSCIPPKEKYAVATLEDATYVLSQTYIVQGSTYTVSNTVVGNSLIVTSIPNSATCVRTTVLYNPADITVVRNITSTEKCEYCQSMIVEYDEVHGIINLVYLQDVQDLLFVTDTSNGILATSPKTHYLLLTRNGTVLEVTEMIVDIKETSIILIIVYVLFAIVAIIGIWRLFKFI